MTGGSRPLEGILVADLSRILAGPLVTQTLAELGATVVKVEHPAGGDDTRSWGPPFRGDTATYFSAVNKGKLSVALDLKDDGDLELARRLSGQADVLVENFRPGVMARLGLGYDEVSATNPGVVYCSISGFGQEGSGAGLPGIDLLIQAMAGWMHVTGHPDGPPTKVGMAASDVVAGLFASTGILAALHERERTGVGRHVQVSLFESALAGLVNLASGYLGAGSDHHRDGNRHPSIAPYEPVMAEDRHFVLAAANDRLFVRTCEVIGRPDMIDDPRFATNADRRRNVESLVAELEAVFATRPAAEWIVDLRAAGVPVGEINTVAEAFALAERLGIEATSELGDGTRGVRSPIRFGPAPSPPVGAPPPLDGSGEEIRRILGSGRPLLIALQQHPDHSAGR
jgi:crotonobetainyl-CoA:carnitine CoA-transferase CaiB-like acyl-CoA transferase